MREQSDLQLWGGLECTVNRVGDRFFDQFSKGGHLQRLEDLDRVAELGIETLRYPVLWERTAPDRPDERDWRFADERLARLRGLGIAPIAGLIHHGSGPRYTSLLDEGFATGLADHARAVAERYPWIEAYTPVNEPLTTARFSALYGHWYPHSADERSFARALIGQVRATVLAMEAIRQVNPAARLVQTDDLGKTHSTHSLRHQADFDNVRRWLTWDLLCGRVDRHHRMWPHLLGLGVDERELQGLLDRPCPPDLIGVNYYLTSERFLDHRVERYPGATHGGNGAEAYADVEAVRVLANGVDGPARLLREAWDRYHLPLAVTECHLGCTREEQVRWLGYVWDEALLARREGADVRAVTAWSLFGAHDWCSLLTCDAARYEPGAFDVRAPEPRPTALAHTVGALARGEAPPGCGEGWWERPIRLIYPPVVGTAGSFLGTSRSFAPRATLVVVGDREGLAAHFAANAAQRGIDPVLLREDEMDPRRPAEVRRVLDLYRPWAVIDLGWEPNAALSDACAEVDARLLTLSDASVFEGIGRDSCVESDPTRPCRARDREIAALRWSGALVVRTGRLFGTPEADGSLGPALRALRRGLPIRVPQDGFDSPTFAPHLVDAALDLLTDGESGVLHLTNGAVLSAAEGARRLAIVAGLDPTLVSSVPDPRLRPGAGSPSHPGLRSERMWIMPELDEAFARAIAEYDQNSAVKASGFLV